MHRIDSIEFQMGLTINLREYIVQQIPYLIWIRGIVFQIDPHAKIP